MVTSNAETEGESRSQTVTLKRGGNVKYRPYTFSALYDVCVLYPAPLRDMLIHLALADRI
jgi:hypothetical protein